MCIYSSDGHWCCVCRAREDLEFGNWLFGKILCENPDLKSLVNDFPEQRKSCELLATPGERQDTGWGGGTLKYSTRIFSSQGPESGAGSSAHRALIRAESRTGV